MTRPNPSRLKTLNAEQLRRLVQRQARTIARLNRILVEREKVFEARTGEMRDLLKAQDALRSDIDSIRLELGNVYDQLNGARRWAEVRLAQVDALVEALTALQQRYIGAKLDMSQCTFAQASEWLKAEREGVAVLLNRIIDEHSCNQAKSQQLERSAA